MAISSYLVVVFLSLQLKMGGRREREQILVLVNVGFSLGAG